MQNAVSFEIDRRAGQHASAVPVDHGGQIDGATRHRDVADVHRPNVIRARDRQRARQVRVDRVPSARLLVFGFRYRAVLPMRPIDVVMCLRLTAKRSARSRPHDMRAPANGSSKCNFSMRRIIISSQLADEHVSRLDQQ